MLGLSPFDRHHKRALERGGTLVGIEQADD